MKTLNLRILFIGLMPILLLFACQTDRSSSDVLPNGQLYFFAEYEPQNRMLVADGTHTLVGLALEIEQLIVDSIQGSKGKQLYISFKKPEQIEQGALFNIPNPDIDLVISSWETPNIFDLNRNITGTVEVLDFTAFQEISLNIDLKMRTGLDKHISFKRKNVNIKCDLFHKAYGAPPYELEDDDSSFVLEELSPKSFDGKWKRVRQIFYMPQTNTYREYFHFPEALTWDIQNGEFVVLDKRTPIRLEERRLVFKEMVSGNTMYFAINSFDGKKLTITNLNDINKTRYVFEKE